MSNLEINLLPWRELQYKKQRYYFIYKAIISSIICILLSIFIFFYIQQIEEKIIVDKEQLQQIENKIFIVKQDIKKLQQNYVSENKQTQNIPTSQALVVLATLLELPLTHGELKELSLDFSTLNLKGIAENNNEFEQLHRFLKQRPIFSKVNLIELKKQSINQKRAVIFEFELTLNNMEKTDETQTSIR